MPLRLTLEQLAACPRVLHKGRCSTVLLSVAPELEGGNDVEESPSAEAGPITPEHGHWPLRRDESILQALSGEPPPPPPGSYAARLDPQPPCRVVVKVYHKAAMQPRHHLNVAREVALLAHLRDRRVPGVVAFLGATECAANVCLRFEACKGGDLFMRMRSGACAALGEAALCQQVRCACGVASQQQAAGARCCRRATPACMRTHACGRRRARAVVWSRGHAARMRCSAAS